MKKIETVCLIGATFSTPNMGVGALTTGTIKSILHQFPNAKIFLLDYGKKEISYDFQTNNGSIDIPLLNMRFSKKLYLKNNITSLILLSLIIKIIPFRMIKQLIISSNKYLNNISKSDLVASIAVGDSFSDIYGIRAFLYVSLPQLLVIFMKKDLILLPQTIGPFKGKMIRIVAKYILNRAKFVFSRDYTGLKEVQNFVGKKYTATKYRFCYDMGFVLDPIKPGKMNLEHFFENRKENNIVVGLNLSGLLYKYSYTYNNKFGLNIDYRKLVYNLIDFLFRKKNVIVLLVPHVYGSLEDSESDTMVCNKIYNELKVRYHNRLFLTTGNYNQHEVKYIINLCDIFIGSRMHACIAALSQEIPAIAIAYSKKFFGLYQTIGVERLVADAREIGEDDIFNIINNVFVEREKISRELSDKIPKIKEGILNILSEKN